MSSYKVTAPLVIVPNADPGVGGDGYFYAGAVIPGGFNDERCDQLVKEGFLEKVKAEPTPAPVAPAVPAKSASKGDWVAYATDEARGADRLTPEDADAMTRDQLAEKYLGATEGGNA